MGEGLNQAIQNTERSKYVKFNTSPPVSYFESLIDIESKRQVPLEDVFIGNLNKRQKGRIVRKYMRLLKKTTISGRKFQKFMLKDIKNQINTLK